MVPTDDTFAAATAVEAVGTPSSGPAPAGSVRHWTAAIRPGWDIAGNANGGYLLAIAARAIGSTLDRPDPVTVTAHFLSPGRPGPVTVDVEVAKQGRMFATASATLAAGGRALLRVLGTFGTLDRGPASELVDLDPAPMPPPGECIPVVATDTFPPPFMGRVELRLHPEDGGFTTGSPSGRPLMRGWFRLLHDEPVDTLALLCAADAFPPTVFNTDLPVAWTPTVELTTHLRARPVAGWLRCRFATHYVTGGFLEEDGEIWDESGRLVAQSRQLALVPRT